MATWKKVLTEEAIATGTSLGTSNVLVPSQNAVKTYVDAQIDTEDTISELNDTTISSLADHDVLAYDNATSKWLNMSASEAGLNQITVDSSLSSSSANPVENHVVYDGLALKEDAITSSNRLSATLIGGNGNVSNTEYGYLNGVTSAIQTQLNGKQATISTGTTDGDLIEVGEDLSDNDFLRVDGSGVKGLTAAQVLSQIGAQPTGSYAALAGSTSQNFSTNDLAVTGNLTVTGTIDTVSQTNTEIVDKTITLAEGSNSEANCSGAGIVLDTNVTNKIAALQWFDDSTTANSTGCIGNGWQMAATSEASTKYNVMGFKTGSGAPTSGAATSSTKAEGEGSFYWDTSGNDLYVCTNSNSSNAGG